MRTNPPPPDLLTPEIAINDHSYFYLGYAISNQVELEAFASAYRATVKAGGSFDGELHFNGVTLQRLSRHTESPDSMEQLANIPVLLDRLGSHEPEGSNVLFADGHVDYIKLGTKWPVTEEAMAVLLELDGLGRKE
jgi:prepilin-type processing-associated H-X9-DG protein